MLKGATLSAIAIAVIFSVNTAYSVDGRTIKATELISGFSQLNNSAKGQTALSENLNTSIAINNNASSAQRARAIADNTIAALIGSMDNGLLVANALGPKMYEIFAAHNNINAATYKASTFSPSFAALFSQVNALIQIDSSFAKNYFANGSINGNPALQATGINLPAGGVYNVYDLAYQPTEENRNTVGDSRPVQVAPDRIESFSALDFFGVPTDSAVSILPTLKGNASFPSGHTAFGFASTYLFAEMVPERFQEFLLRGAEYGNSRVTLGAHYALDVIGARIMTTYAMAQILNNNPDYVGQNIASLFGTPMTTTTDFQGLMATAQTDLRTLLEQGCGTTLAACSAADNAERLQQAARNKADYTYSLTYGLASIGPTDLAPVVPEGAEVLLASRFPYLTAEQRREVLATTEIESGHALDNGSGWARLNLYAAADGYGAFNGNITVAMDASLGGFSAYDAWNNDIAGNGNFVKNGSGTLELTGNNRFSGTTEVAGGSLLVNGYHGNSAVTVDHGALLGGSGTVGTLTAQSGAIIAPGNSIGTLQVANGVTFQPGSHYAVEVATNGSSDLIQSGGVAILHGGEVNVSLENQGNLLSKSDVRSLLGQQYTILSAQQGISGQFDSVRPDYLFLGSTLSYQTNQVLLNVGRSATAFADVAQTQNERAVARAAETLGAGNPVYESILTSSTPWAARQAFHQLSGQIHADIASAQINESRYLREALNGRLRQAEGVGSSPEIKTSAGGVWAQWLGAWDHASGNANATGYQASTYGVLMGLDSAYTGDGQLGVATGYTRTSLDGTYGSSADSDNYHLGVYGDKQFGELALRAGSTYTWHRIDTDRTINYVAQSDRTSAKYSARTQQLFAEAGYGIKTAAVNLEPFVNLAYVNFQNSGIAEHGAATALRGDKQHTDTTVSTLGLRADTRLQAVILRGELGWQHQYGELDRATGLMFNDSSSSFVIRSVPVSRDGAVLKASAEVAVGKDATLSLGYGGLLSQNHQDNRVEAGFTWRF
ncbi:MULTISPECIES: autotransporter outer membrane beta-barrel domain-containing protein [unclassified Serratia (in: enterobacteria)]|uniref:autotransporter outer membrane beta-barrel domain-containing protein n=1 Tax=unclassified Serratia (in: enterobacteria) TaxID=2647522 RepID=UPI00068E731C|nr:MULTISPECIES: autotransporter outer membrane beta-barrel domain-containing protein [unclassified Serratia (in: enterobacteria)]